MTQLSYSVPRHLHRFFAKIPIGVKFRDPTVKIAIQLPTPGEQSRTIQHPTSVTVHPTSNIKLPTPMVSRAEPSNLLTSYSIHQEKIVKLFFY